MLPLSRRLSGDSDSSTASSKGGGGAGVGGGGRHSLGGASRRSGDEVVLLVSRKEGKHMIERAGGGNQGPSLRPSIPRARSQSRERSALAPVLKSNPPQGSSNGSRTSRTERGRSLGSDVARRLHAPRSHSQSKLSTRANAASPGPASCIRDPQPPSSDRKEDLRAKQAPPSSPRLGGGFSKRQSSSCTNSPIKDTHNNNSSPSKKTITTPRPSAPRPLSLGRNRLLPPITSGGWRSAHSSPHNVHRHPAPLARTLQGPRSVGRGQHRNWSGPEHQEPEKDDVNPGFQMLPTIDPQREQDLYRSFEAEFLANTQQARGALTRIPGAATLQGSLTSSVPAPANSNITDSVYSSSNSSSSSRNVGAKMGTQQDLRESKQTNPNHLPLDDPLHVLYGDSFGELHHFVQGEQWRECRGGLKTLPAISSSIEDRELSSYLSESDLMNQVPSQQAVNCGNMNGDHKVLTANVGITNNQGGDRDWGTEHIGDIPLENQKILPYDIENCDGSDNLPLPEACPSPVPFPPSEDCSFQDSSSESSSMCFSLSESHSESPQPSSPVANGDAHDKAIAPKNGQKKGDKLDSLTKHRPRAKIRPRIDNRPENCPTRIPTPVSYGDLQVHETLSLSCTPPLSPQCSRPSVRTTTCKILHPAFADMIHPQKHSPALGNKDCSYPGKSGSLGTDAWL